MRVSKIFRFHPACSQGMATGSHKDLSHSTNELHSLLEDGFCFLRAAEGWCSTLDAPDQSIPSFLVLVQQFCSNGCAQFVAADAFWPDSITSTSEIYRWRRINFESESDELPC